MIERQPSNGGYRIYTHEDRHDWTQIADFVLRGQSRRAYVACTQEDDDGPIRFDVVEGGIRMRWRPHTRADRQYSLSRTQYACIS